MRMFIIIKYLFQGRLINFRITFKFHICFQKFYPFVFFFLIIDYILISLAILDMIVNFDSQLKF